MGTYGCSSNDRGSKLGDHLAFLVSVHDAHETALFYGLGLSTWRRLENAGQGSVSRDNGHGELNRTRAKTKNLKRRVEAKDGAKT